MLGLALGFDVDRHDDTAYLFLECSFDPVADRVECVHGHRARHNELKVHERSLTRVSRQQVVGLDRALGIGGR